MNLLNILFIVSKSHNTELCFECGFIKNTNDFQCNFKHSLLFKEMIAIYMNRE
jgi:hypothetical protein